MEAGQRDPARNPEKTLTYRQLNRKSNQLARVLRRKGVRKDTIIGIMLDRSPEMIIGIMAVLKAGGAYLPMEPGSPANRRQLMLNDSKAGHILTTSRESTREIIPILKVKLGWRTWLM
jgi:fengycin family lipopeptide synthetase D